MVSRESRITPSWMSSLSMMNAPVVALYRKRYGSTMPSCLVIEMMTAVRAERSNR
jgi:hypothetical protein